MRVEGLGLLLLLLRKVLLLSGGPLLGRVLRPPRGRRGLGGRRLPYG